MLQWISQVSFLRLGRINTSASIPHVLCFSFLTSLLPSVSPSFSPSSCDRTFERACRLTHSERITRSSRHRAFLCSRDLARICIRANWLSLVWDLLTLNMVLEAVIPVSCFRSTGQIRQCALRMSRYVASITFTTTWGEIIWTLGYSIALKWQSPFSGRGLVAGPVNGYISVYIHWLP